VKLARVVLAYVTGLINNLVLNRAMRSEPGGYVLKPYETSDLKIAIETPFKSTERIERENNC